MIFCPYCGRQKSLWLVKHTPLPVSRCIYCGEEVVVDVDECLSLLATRDAAVVFVSALNLATMLDPPTALISEALKDLLSGVLERINAEES